MAGDAVAEIKARLDIVDVVAGYVSLTRSGRGHKGLCPFHSEKTPSFTVSQERQAWYCFGCSDGGDIFTFVQKVENSGFREVLEMLAERAGVELEERRPGAVAGKAKLRKRVLDLNGRTQAYYQHVLWETPAGETGRRLLADRGVGDATAREFGIGFAPSGGQAEDALVRYLVARAGATLAECVEAGLAHETRGRGRDRFRHRLVFPIRDERGEVIAFGARAIGDDVPKYLNSPETPVYHKSHALFGLDRARDAIRATRQAVIVEGYFDVVAAHVAGVGNAVASSGTAFTREQMKLIARFAESVVFCFDNDDAGRTAASRAADIAAAEGVEARIVVLPDGFKDPDELVRTAPERFAEVVAGAPAEWQVLLDRALDGGEGGSAAARRAAVERVAGVLARIPSASTRDMYVQQAARRLDLSTATLTSDVGKALHELAAGSRRVVMSAPEPRPVVTAADEEGDEADDVEPERWERFLAAAVVIRPELARVLLDQGLGISEITHPAVRTLVAVAIDLPDGAAISLNDLPPAARSLASRVLLAPPPEVSAPDAMVRRALADTVALIRESSLAAELNTVRRDIRIARDAGRDDEVNRLAARMHELAAGAPHLRRRVNH